MNQAHYCGQCGAANPPDANFCVSCGARLDKPPVAPPAPGPGAGAPYSPPPSQGYGPPDQAPGAPYSPPPGQGYGPPGQAPGAPYSPPPGQGYAPPGPGPGAPYAPPPPQGYAPPPQGYAPPGKGAQAPYAPAGPAPAPTAPQTGWTQEKEPMLLLDVTGSMNYGTSANDNTPRRDTIREAISIIVSTLAAEDTQAGHEEEGGGLRTVIFAGGTARDIGDLNPANLVEKWAQIPWAGGTRIMPGWNTLVKTYMDEFGREDPSTRPILMALVITDGEADDTAPFAQAISQASGGVYVALAIIGYGPDHDSALRAYQSIEQSNPNVKVLTLASETDPQVIANALLKMIA